MFQFDKVYNSEHNTERFFFVLGTKKECEDFYNTGYTTTEEELNKSQGFFFYYYPCN